MAIQIASNNLDSPITFPANTEIYFTVIGLSATRLKGLLELNGSDHLIDTIVNPKESFLFYQNMGTEMQMTLKQLAEPPTENGLAGFYYRLKAETLLYHVFNQLRNRQFTGHSSVN